MSFTTSDDIYIKKLKGHLIITDFETLAASHARDVAMEYLKTFNELWRKVADSYLKNGMCSQELMREYEEAKANLITAHEFFNNNYGK